MTEPPPQPGIRAPDVRMIPLAAARDWCAGFWEADGSVSIVCNRTRGHVHGLQVRVVSTDQDASLTFKRLFGGTITRYDAGPPRWPAWIWVASSERAERFLREVRPALRTIRKQQSCELALKFRDQQRETWRQMGGKSTRKLPSDVVETLHSFHVQLKDLQLERPLVNP